MKTLVFGDFGRRRALDHSALVMRTSMSCSESSSHRSVSCARFLGTKSSCVSRRLLLSLRTRDFLPQAVARRVPVAALLELPGDLQQTLPEGRLLSTNERSTFRERFSRNVTCRSTQGQSS